MSAVDGSRVIGALGSEPRDRCAYLGIVDWIDPEHGATGTLRVRDDELDHVVSRPHPHRALCEMEELTGGIAGTRDCIEELRVAWGELGALRYIHGMIGDARDSCVDAVIIAFHDPPTPLDAVFEELTLLLFYRASEP
jgi:hypothetical protein